MIFTTPRYQALSEAARSCRALSTAENRVAKNERWSYILEACNIRPNMATIKVYDNESRLVGYWSNKL